MFAQPKMKSRKEIFWIIETFQFQIGQNYNLCPSLGGNFRKGSAVEQTKKTFLPIERLADVGENWYVGMEPDREEYFLLRINMAGDVWAGHPLLDIRINFGIMFIKPNPGGMPDKVECDKVDAIGERIYSLLKRAGPTLHVATFTSAEFKEFVFYTHNRQAIPQIYQQIQTETDLYTIDCAGESDPEWTDFAYVMSKCAPLKNLN